MIHGIQRVSTRSQVHDASWLLTQTCSKMQGTETIRPSDLKTVPWVATREVLLSSEASGFAWGHQISQFRCMISFDSLIRYSNLTQFLHIFAVFLSRQLGCPTFFQPLFFTTSHAFCNSGLAGRLCLVSFEVTAVFTARKVLEILKPWCPVLSDAQGTNMIISISINWS